MTDQPFHLKVTKDNIVAAMERDDYAWPVDHVFIPALAQFMREKHTAAGERQHPPEITPAGWHAPPPQ